jgi:hypothetical protein
VTQEHVDELEALARLADFLMEATVWDATPGVNAMARALAIRLKTLADGVRLV